VPDRNRLDGKVAVVTGASSGHGRAIALELARQGAVVFCLDLRKQALSKGFEDDIAVDTDDVIKGFGGQAEFIQADITRATDLDAAVDRAVKLHGHLDVWINNAGVFIRSASVVDETEDEFTKTITINLTGTWLGCKSAIRQMQSQDVNGRSRGKIVNIGSIAAVIGQPNLNSYSASKAAVHQMTRCLAIECAPLAINVNAVAPGYFPTAMNRVFWDDPDALAQVKKLHPWPEMGTPADVGAAVAFLASPGADWITGAVLPVDGGVLAK
jgi:NAD(P)-dependent dehydrogenase (short-subunit alcohol dehydrogenase family)